MTRQTSKRVLIGTAAAAAALAIGLGALFAFTPKVKFPEAIEGRPLLHHEGELFTDRQAGIQFAPPAYWSLQARSTVAPRDRKPERMLVKFKRLIPGLQMAWIRVSVADVPEDQTPAELLKKRKPPETDWTVKKEVEDGLEVGGKPAARITFGGPYDPDQKGLRDYTCEVVAIRRGPQVFYFAGTYETSDPKGQKRIRTALDTVVLDPDRFAGGD
jgi:hypothetical protein